MTFNKMRFPIVWITFALCVILCGVQGGPAGERNDAVVAFVQDLSGRIARQYGYDESDEDDDDSTLSNYQGAVGGNGEDDDEDDGDEDDRRRSFGRNIREISEKPVIEEETDESITATPTDETPLAPAKKPSVLELLSSALDKAIEATSKIPTQQVATDAVGVFQILGQVFSEAIDKVIGSDDGDTEGDGPDDSDEPAAEPIVDKTPDAAEPSSAVIPVTEEQMKVEMPLQQEISQSDKEIVNNL